MGILRRLLRWVPHDLVDLAHGWFEGYVMDRLLPD